MSRTCNVLVLCTGNSCRSVMAEALLNHWGRGRFRAYSAGSQPSGAVNPLALELLERHRLPVAGLRSKSWDEFAAPDAPPMDIVITVCDDARDEVCPYFPGAPLQVHWGLPDPARAKGSHDERMAVFRDVFLRLEARIKLLCALRDDHFEHLMLKGELERIHRDTP